MGICIISKIMILDLCLDIIDIHLKLLLMWRSEHLFLLEQLLKLIKGLLHDLYLIEFYPPLQGFYD